MGMSDTNLVLSEKDLNAVGGSKFLSMSSRTMLGEFRENDNELVHEREQSLQQHKEAEVLEKCDVPVFSLNIQLPFVTEANVDEEVEEDGCRTPTSSKHKIPLICPATPRKPKSQPSAKRRSSESRIILLDLSNEMESLFPPALRADLGNKIKKVRKENDLT